jgi:hypothetical protein
LLCDCSEVVLDSRGLADIKASVDGKDAPHSLKPHATNPDALGSALIIALPDGSNTRGTTVYTHSEETTPRMHTLTQTAHTRRLCACATPRVPPPRLLNG